MYNYKSKVKAVHVFVGVTVNLRVLPVNLKVYPYRFGCTCKFAGVSIKYAVSLS